LITPDKWIEQAQAIGFRDDVLPLILKDNALKVLGLAT
jgi:predicted TIM-barrel fold metal-dependent hydrolase